MVAQVKAALAALAVGLLLGLAGGWVVAGWKHGAERADAEKALREQIEEEQERGNKIASGWAAALEYIRGQQRETVRTVTREIEKPVYRDCVVPDTGRLLLDGAIDQANAAGKPRAAVPAATQAPGQ